jgi:ribonuclease R
MKGTMRRERNRRGSTTTPRDNATQARTRAAGRTPQSPESAVLNVLRKAARPLRLDEVTRRIRARRRRAQAEAGTRALLKRGEVMLNRRGQYCLREQIAGLVVGTVQGARNGDGQLLPDDGSRRSTCPHAQMREVMHGDRLAVRIEAARFRGRAQGTIVEVLERRTKEVVGRLRVESGVAYLTPDNARIPHRVLVPSQQLGAAEDPARS